MTLLHPPKAAPFGPRTSMSKYALSMCQPGTLSMMDFFSSTLKETRQRNDNKPISLTSGDPSLKRKTVKAHLVYSITVMTPTGEPGTKIQN